MTAKDFPAQIEYIRKETGKKTLAYIGHSQGNYMMFNLFASQPQYSQFIKPHIALSPVTYFTRFEASLKYLGPIKKQILMYVILIYDFISCLLIFFLLNKASTA